MTDKTDITLTINGRDHAIRVEPRKTLVDAIREDCGQTGTHIGCEHGVCGTCTVILDGEAAWDGQSGYHVFDILWLNGRAVTALPLEQRRALLESLPFEAPMRRVALVDDREPWERARREGWEGVIAKRRDSPYEHRRSKHWLKMKCEATEEFVVGGFTDPPGGRVGHGTIRIARATTTAAG